MNVHSVASALVTLVASTAAAAQEAPPVAVERTATVAPAPQYGAGPFHRFFFGSLYRDLWTTPVDVPVLDLRRMGGGLTPTTAGGGFQTKSLRFQGRDSLQYGFRSIDKDPSNFLEALRGTFVEEVLRDQTSSAHPVGPALVAPLQEAIDLLLPWRQLVVLPDDPALGEFRERFRGTIGFFEPRAIVGPGLKPFADASEILESHELFPLLRASPADRIDAGAFLRARLFDVFIGDWDRHRGQWGWARFGDDKPRTWVPIPEDRDQAFIRFDGVMLALARIVAPQLTNFSDRYGSMFGQTFNGRELDRWLLTGFEAPAWDSVATWMQTRLTDAVLQAAVDAMPEEYQALDGERMLRALTARRDGLRDMARAYYDLLADEVDIHGTDADETATIEWHADGGATVAIAESGRAPYVQRRLHPGETREVRVYLHGGNDRLLIRGSARGRILLRVITGAGDDELVNAGRTPVHYYTDDRDRATGAVRVDRRRWNRQAVVDSVPDRDWGAFVRFVPWGTFAPDLGLFLGGGVYRLGYGFRYLPWDSKIHARVGYSTGAGAGRAQVVGTFYRSNSGLRYQFDILVSGIEIIKFHGFGNDIAAPEPNDFYRVNERRVSFYNAVVTPLGTVSRLEVGSRLSHSESIDQPGRILATLPGLYGTGEFTRFGLEGVVEVDMRDEPVAARSGVHLRARAAVHPAILDVATPYTTTAAVASTYLTAPRAPLLPTLALRAGGRAVFGTFPYQDAAYLGGPETVRLGRKNRYAGDAALWGNAELRLRLARTILLLPADVGVFGLTDAGRVFHDGDPDAADRIHLAVGGGIWVAFVERRGTLTAAVTSSEERIGVYLSAGFAY